MAGLGAFLKDAERLLKVAFPRAQFAGLGASKLDEHGTWPRVVWVVQSVAHAAAEKSRPGGRTDGQQILTRGLNLEAHLWGKDLEMLEDLIDATICAVHELAYGSVQFAGEDWPTEEVVDDGLVAIVRMRVDARVVRRRFLVRDADKDSRFTTTQPTGATVDSTNAPD